MRRYWREEEGDDHEALWHELAERACHIPGSSEHPLPGDPHRAVHRDLERLDDGDLQLEKYRAIFRACFERDVPNLWWLLRRIGRSEYLQEQRATEEREMAARARQEERRQGTSIDQARLQALQVEAERARERVAHEAWLACQEEQQREREWAAHEAWLAYQIERELERAVAD